MLLVIAVYLVSFHTSAQTTPSPAALGAGTYLVAEVQMIGLDADLEQRVRQKVRVKAGDVVTAGELRSMRSDLRALDDRLTLASAQRPREQAPNERILVIRLMASRAATDIPANPTRVDPAVQMRNLALRVIPDYPPAVREAGVRGEVVMDAIVGADGLVKDVRVLSGDPRLAEPAIEAVGQWVFRPTLLNGQPIAVIAQIRLNFGPVPVSRP